MNQPALSPVVTLQRSRLTLPSQVAYDLVRVPPGAGAGNRPSLLGSGRFAKVFAAQQTIVGRESRSVAIKVLHDHADRRAELLFSQEVALNREFASGPLQGVAPILDVIHLGPLVMCGCGTLYHPRCPRGCNLPLQRFDPPTREFPSLRCSKCEYELSAEFVHQRGHELHGPRAKPCCTSDDDAFAGVGTIVNFVLREAMVMESLDMSLGDYAAYREKQLGTPLGAGERALHYFGMLPPRSRQRMIEQKVRLLEKIHLMVQIAEAVAWLHGEKKVVHKDLAPDNIMIRHAPGDLRGAAFADEPVTRQLDQAANLCTEICVIDFGLSDKETLTRSWYEDADTSMATTKLPYLSPEARHRRQAIGCQLDFDAPQSRFRVPDSLEQSAASIYEHDLIADPHDYLHERDIVIQKIDGQPGHRHAYFSGTQPNTNGRHLEIVRPLGEAHDVYALGAIFYYILTGRHDQVDALSHLVGSLQDQPCRLDRVSLSRRDNYGNRCKSIREPFWRDELMLVILRAMVRGRPESFVRDRTVRGPRPAQRFLTELKRIQHGLIAEVFAERGHLRAAYVRCAVAATVIGALLGGACKLGRSQDPPQPQPQVNAPAESVKVNPGR